MSKCVVCGSDEAGRYRLLRLDVAQILTGDARYREQEYKDVHEIWEEPIWSADALVLCRPCEHRVRASCGLTQHSVDENEELIERVMSIAARVRATKEQMDRMWEAAKDGATNKDLFRIAAENPADPPATNCKPKAGGGNVVYLPNAEPRRRVRPGRR